MTIKHFDQNHSHIDAISQVRTNQTNQSRPNSQINITIFRWTVNIDSRISGYLFTKRLTWHITQHIQYKYSFRSCLAVGHLCPHMAMRCETITRTHLMCAPTLHIYKYVWFFYLLLTTPHHHHTSTPKSLLARSTFVWFHGTFISTRPTKHNGFVFQRERVCGVILPQTRSAQLLKLQQTIPDETLCHITPHQWTTAVDRMGCTEHTFHGQHSIIPCFASAIIFFMCERRCGRVKCLITASGFRLWGTNGLLVLSLC